MRSFDAPVGVLSSNAPNATSDMVLSPDGSRIFVGTNTGAVQVFDVRTGELLSTWQVGKRLGGMDISEDGSFLIVSDREFTTRVFDQFGNAQYTVSVYKVDTQSGAASRLDYQATQFLEYTFHDVAILSTGEVFLTQAFLGSGWVQPKSLDLSTGVFSNVALDGLEFSTLRNNSIVSLSEDRTKLLVAEADISNAPVLVFDASSPSFNLLGSNTSSGFNRGIHAISSDGEQIANFVYGAGILIFDGAAGFVRNLSNDFPELRSSPVGGLAFSADGESLFVYDPERGRVLEISTSTWQQLRSFAVGPAGFAFADASFGNNLLLTDDGFLLVEGVEAIYRVDVAGVQGTAVADAINGTNAPDRLYGLGGDDRLIGGAGNDVLSGGDGADTMAGGVGDDLYYVSAIGDVVLEEADQGSDTVIVQASATNFVLTGDSHVETISAEAGTAPINITGNWQSQTINGNDGANILSAGGPDAPDTLNGGLGDDTYRVFATGDVINDTGGNDIVYTSGTSYFLYSTAAVETLSTSLHAGTESFFLVGNGASQVIIGNYGDNIINGRSGDGQGNPDTIIGLFGNDTFAVFLQGDVVREEVGQGSDTVVANASYHLREGTEIEVLTAVDQSATDAAQQFTLRGNGFGQTIVGNDTINVIDGGGGNDVLIGRGGNDTFAFTTTLSSSNVDTIQDFAAGDRIGLASDIFASVTDGGILAGEFVIGTVAADADDRLIYDQATGRLWLDADGNGANAAVLFAQLAAGTALSVGDFVTIVPVATLPAA